MIVSQETLKQKARSACAKRASVHEHALAVFIGLVRPRPQAEHQIGAAALCGVVILQSNGGAFVTGLSMGEVAMTFGVVPTIAHESEIAHSQRHHKWGSQNSSFTTILWTRDATKSKRDRALAKTIEEASSVKVQQLH
jgi:hypothetical protein